MSDTISPDRGLTTVNRQFAQIAGEVFRDPIRLLPPMFGPDNQFRYYVPPLLTSLAKQDIKRG